MFFIIFCVLLFQIAMTNVNGASTKRSPDDLPIKYPGPTKHVDMSRYGNPGNDQVPEACVGQNFCTIKPKNYPEEHFNELFKNLRPSLPLPQAVPDDVSLDNRQGDPNDKDNCDSIITYEPLYQVRDKREENWRTVIQAPRSDYIQRVRLESCSNLDAPCFTVFPTITGYTTHCKQKYSNWEVLVSKGKNATETIVAELPTCCSCHYRPTDFASRFGKPKN